MVQAASTQHAQGQAQSTQHHNGFREAQPAGVPRRRGQRRQHRQPTPYLTRLADPLRNRAGFLDEQGERTQQERRGAHPAQADLHR
jgi:hypothetical protein